MGTRVGHDEEGGTMMRGKPNEKAQEMSNDVSWAVGKFFFLFS